MGGYNTQRHNGRDRSVKVGHEIRTSLVNVTACPSVRLSARISQQELVRRRDSERELIYDDIVHVEAYAH